MDDPSASSSATTFTLLEPFPYVLDYDCPAPWTSAQENVICQDYPFSSTQEESVEEFVIRRYLETLWLPESIMQLHHFVRSLRRVLPSATGAHPLHAALKPLLLSVRATQDKYHSELPQILQDGGGAGELEETVMWYAWSKEKFEQNAGADDAESSKDAEEKWKKYWMERLERREVQIQILLYLQLLSLPAPPPSTPTNRSKALKKPKRKQVHGPPSPVKPLFPLTSNIEATMASMPPTPAKSTTSSLATNVDDNLTLDDRLEFFMDKLSLWQLVASLNPPGSSQSTVSQPKGHNERDWMQIFCEDVVEHLFKESLPEQCALLRTKVFPHSPFSDASDNELTPLSPDLRAVGKGKSKGKRPASPLRLTELQKHRAEPTQPPSWRAESQEPGMAPDRHRSRSRSVSISVQEVRARGASRGGVVSSKNLFKDEVEMKRTAPRARILSKPIPETDSQQGRTFSRQNSAANAFLPASASQPRSPSQEYKTLVADTPVKKSVKVEDNPRDIIMESPDALLLTNKTCGETGKEVDGEPGIPGGVQTFVMDTPVKKRSKR